MNLFFEGAISLTPAFDDLQTVEICTIGILQSADQESRRKITGSLSDPVSLSRARQRRVASKPSSSGIWQSISTASKLSVSSIDNASLPSLATTDSMLSFSSILRLGLGVAGSAWLTCARTF